MKSLEIGNLSRLEFHYEFHTSHFFFQFVTEMRTEVSDRVRTPQFFFFFENRFLHSLIIGQSIFGLLNYTRFINRSYPINRLFRIILSIVHISGENHEYFIRSTVGCVL